jgi:hypothetical protein
MVNVNLFSQLLAHIPREKFDKLVKEHRSDKHSKGINSWTHFVSMLFCHIGGAESVRDISNGLMSTTGNASHLGISRVPSKSSLSYINAHRPFELFRDFYHLLRDHLCSTHSFRRTSLNRLKRKVYLMDASIVPLCLKVFDWASYRSTKGAVKLHTVLDYDGLIPVFADLTEGSRHEVVVAGELIFPRGSVLVFDRGYLDFSWLNDLDSNGCFFVTRAKSNMAYLVEREYETEGDVISDQDITFKNWKSKKEYPGKMRLVKYLDSTTGEEYAFLTNNRTWVAKTVADIYKERWHIETFFKHLKQNLRIRSFVGTSQNAVQIQIWTALTAILLLKYLKEKAKYNWHLSNLVTFIRLNLFVKISLHEWLNAPFYVPDKKKLNAQLNIFDG